MRTITYWEKKRAVASKLLKELHLKQHVMTPRPAPRRRTRDSTGKIHVMVHAAWAARYRHWKRCNVDRRTRARNIEKLRVRITYYDEQISALQKKTSWTTLSRGLL